MLMLGFLLIFTSHLYTMEVKFEKTNIFNKAWIQLIFDTTDTASQIGSTQQNWIGIYKKGASNEWKNVISWAWVKDVQNTIAPGDSAKNRYYSYDLPDGEYELRFFLDNSYEIFASYAFEANKVKDMPMLSIEQQTKTNIFFSSTYGKQTWVGIYQKNQHDNDWKYVQAWSWVTDTLTTINLTDLPRGDYIARLFYDNSYKDEDYIAFSHNGTNQENFVKVEKFNGYSRIDFSSSFQVGDGKSWVGLYKKANSNASENRLAWKEVKSTKEVFYLQTLEVGEYELRLFDENEDNMVVKTGFSVDGKQVFTFTEQEYSQHNSYNMLSMLTYFAPMGDEDWVGLFEKGAKKIRANLISWGRPKTTQGLSNYVTFKTPGRVGEFELVYFTNDSYEQFGNSLSLIFN
ncbi:MAG: Unknown protein [uncultured Sulfurovum sp.]|uniref:SKICH domain-containing protein n=1 Tax=uncultured Sulfurovum sp. TaxID=269237 RepID=A0A6S6SW78_9BACT|nr:MAG: Unknown protein [uncultured Sulfurovum sp.]